MTRLVVIAMVAAGVAATRQTSADAIPASAIGLLASGGLPDTVAATAEQREGLEELSRVALDNVIARHGLANTADERTRMLVWNRAELRAELFALIVAAARKPFSQQTSAEAMALDWLGDVQQRKNVLVAQASLDEYLRFYGNTAFTGGYPENACTYHPPAPFQDAYPGGPIWIGCTDGRVPIIDLGPRIPTVEEFTQWGTAKVEGALYTAGSAVLSGEAFRLVVGLGAAATVVGATAAVIAALPLATYTALGLAFFPYTFMVPAGAMTAAIEASIGGMFAMSAGAVAAVVVTIVIAIALVVMAIIQAVQASEVGPKLQEQLANAQNTPVTGEQAVAGSGGTQTTWWAVQQVTTSPDVVSAEGTPQPPQDGRYTIELRNSSGALINRTTTLNMGSFTPNGDYTALRREFRSGWWVDPTADPSAPPAQRIVPNLAIPLKLWDPTPTVTSGGVSVERSGFSYPADVTTVFDQGRLRWRATVMGREDFPRFGTPCSDFHRDGCLVTDELPLEIDAGGSTNQRRFARIVPNTLAGQLTLTPSTTTIEAGDTFTVTAGLGAVGLVDGDGDPVNLTWTFTSCPALACLLGNLFTASGSTATVTLRTPGVYTLTATAMDSLGAQQTATIDLVVANTPPTVTAGLLPFSGRTVNLLGTVADVSDFPTLGVTVDWGDGSPLTTQNLLNSGNFALVHTYPGAGTYTATVTGSDGALTATTRVSVRIGSTAPQIRIVGQNPPSWTTVTPGDPLSIIAEVDDPDAGQAITVTAEWYDGRQETIDLPAGSPRRFTVDHTLRAWTGATAVQLLRLTAVDASNLSGSITFDGTVSNLPPSFLRLTGTAATVGSASRVSGLVTDANRDAVSVEVDWGDGTTSPPVAVNALAQFAQEHIYTAPGSYTVTVRAISNGPSESVTTTQEVVLVVGAAKPTAVVGLTAAPGTGSAQVSWSAPTSAGGVPLTGYTVTATPPSGSGTAPVEVNVPAGTNSTIVGGLTGGVRWTISVVATNEAGAGPARTTTVTPLSEPTTVPLAPSNLSFIDQGSNLQISWTDNSSDETQFEIQRARWNGSGWVEYVSLAAVNADTTTMTDVGAPDARYAYFVRARNSVGVSEWVADTWLHSTAVTSPAKPTSLQATSTGNGVSLTWVDQASDELGHDILRTRLVAGVWSEWTLVATPDYDTTSYLDTDLTGGHYAYLVRSYNGAGASGWEVAVVEHPAPTTAPPAPEAVGTLFNGDGIEVGWVDSTNEQYYEVMRARFDPASQTWGEWTQFLLDRNDTNLFDTPVPAGQYAYLVRAGNGAGVSDWTVVLVAKSSA